MCNVRSTGISGLIPLVILPSAAFSKLSQGTKVSEAEGGFNTVITVTRGVLVSVESKFYGEQCIAQSSRLTKR